MQLIFKVFVLSWVEIRSIATVTRFDVGLVSKLQMLHHHQTILVDMQAL